MGELWPQHWPGTLESSSLGWGPNLLSRAAPSPTPTPRIPGPTYRLASPPPSLHNLAARPTHPTWAQYSAAFGTVLSFQRPALERDPEAMGMCRGFGGGGNGSHHRPALPLSSTRSPGFSPKPVCPDRSLLRRAPARSSARRGAGPGRIPRAERGRTESGPRGRGPAGVRGVLTGLAARRATGSLWPLPREVGAGEAGPQVGWRRVSVRALRN